MFSYAVLTDCKSVKESVYGSLVFHDAGLLDALHKLLRLHVCFRQLEALHGTLLVPVVVTRTFPLLVPLHPTDEPFQFWPFVRLPRGFVDYYYSTNQYGCYDSIARSYLIFNVLHALIKYALIDAIN